MPSAGYWRLVDPDGVEVFNAVRMANLDTVKLNKSGTYFLAIEGGNTVHTAQDYAFALVAPTDKGAIAVNSTLTDTLPAGDVQRYSLHLDQPSVLAFDNLGANPKLRWRLDGPQGVVFDWGMASDNHATYLGGYGTRYLSDYSGRLAAGETGGYKYRFV